MKTLESKDVLTRYLPHIKGLRTEDLVYFLVNDSEKEEYLPSNYNHIVYTEIGWETYVSWSFINH